MAKFDPNIVAHLEWIGFVKPTGLVVSAPALVRAGAILDRRDTEGQRILRDCVKESPSPHLPDFRAFAESVLGWSFTKKGFAGTEEAAVPSELAVAHPNSDERLRPDFAVREPEPQNGAPPWQLLVRLVRRGEEFDGVGRGDGRMELSEHGRMERLLRGTNVPAGLLFNGTTLRLVSAPKGETSGWIDFRVGEMVQPMGRPICSALRLLLGQSRLLALPRAQRLVALLVDSRKFQNEVSERLAEQVLQALYELLRGFQAAHDRTGRELLRQPLGQHPDEVYRGLLTVILRLVFLLYAEERDMLPEDETFTSYYSLAGLYERLREDAALFPDTMDLRYGAWAQLLVLFRMIHDGAECGRMRLPKRHGVLFNPDRFPFLEGRTGVASRQVHERIEPPLVPDGTIFRVLEKLLVLDGERITYRALDVEQIGSVYETMMGFRLETAIGRSVAIKPQKRAGAPTAVNLEELLAEPAAKREKWLQEHAGRKFTDSVKKAASAAKSIEDLHAALLPTIDLAATPDLVPKGAMVLRPSEERRRSGSHYTPRTLTEPIVRTTLEPILARLRGADGRPPRPETILDLKVCDPAMGSGAFLVEACRQLGDALVEAWHVYGDAPAIPPDEDEFVLARRLVAQRCLYGVDRNPVAVDLAKMSLWLATLAKDHPLTFVDHALQHGDSLVGLSLRQLEAFHWDAAAPSLMKGLGLRDSLDAVRKLRRQIRDADEAVQDWELRDLWDRAQTEAEKARRCGDLAVAAFFEGEKLKDRERKRSEYLGAVMGGDAEQYRDWLAEQRQAEPPLAPFHWEVEFPEVFERENPGFDAIVGNPPFQAGRDITTVHGDVYSQWLLALHSESSGGADLVAHFYRRAFMFLRMEGTFGLIATKTIAQGDTRSTGLRWICHHGGDVFAARKRIKWPGLAAVVVSVVHVAKGPFSGPKRLDDREVPTITAFLFHRGGHDDPAPLTANDGKSFQGSIVLGMGFTFDDTDIEGAASSIDEMRGLLKKDQRNQDVICPYIGGAELNTSPTHAHNRYVINFAERTEEECRRGWPDLMRIVEQRVRKERATKSKEIANWPWWQFWRYRRELYAAIESLDRVLVIGRNADSGGLVFLPPRMVYSEQLVVFAVSSYAGYCALQARPHEIWFRRLCSTFKDDLRYTPSRCFETFPFPNGWEMHPALEAAGKAYYEFRAALMVRRNEGLTKTYNHFHNRYEKDPDILKLRELHAEMDRAVLDAYGWSEKDLPTHCDFFLDYEIDEEEWGDKKKPYRYRWPDDVRDDVLARLLELGAQRAKAEALSVAPAAPRPKKAARGRKRGGEGPELFDPPPKGVSTSRP